MKLREKIAIVTGASQGIGRGIAMELAEAGADVVVNCDRNIQKAEEVANDIRTVNCDRNIQKAEEVANEIRTCGRRAMVAQADVSKSMDVNRMVQLALEKFGRVDILVNNAGIEIGGAIENVSEEVWDRVMGVNLKGVFLCCQTVGRHMIQRKSGGSIINVASISGSMPETNSGPYTPSKAGMIGLTKLLAMEWAKYNIRVNSVSPGPIMTPLQRAAYPSEALLAARNKAVPMNRHGTPEEIGRAVMFLASEDSSYMTGTDLVVDGGSLPSMFHLVRKMAENI
jgi:NAD(P)-dependent dehydrogenase (short-subunit alcohol dehydrogenase family)